MVENTSSLYMPVAPAYTANGGGFGSGLGYGGDFWLILILLFAFGGFGGGWGMNGFGGWGGGAFGFDGLYPWMNNAQITTNGFQNQALNSAISGLQNSITSGFGDVQLGIAGVNQNICQTGNGITQAVANGFAQAEIADNARQMASMQQAFANQTAMNQGFNGLQSQFAQCCCDNKILGVQTQNLVQSEAGATRLADANNTREIIDANNKNSQAILDKLCALELDGVKGQLAQAQRDNVALQNQLNMANLNASQVAQTAEIRTAQATTANQLVSELRSCPIPSQPVYGNQPIFTCAQNLVGSNCGCGCGTTF